MRSPRVVANRCFSKGRLCIRCLSVAFQRRPDRTRNLTPRLHPTSPRCSVFFCVRVDMWIVSIDHGSMAIPRWSMCGIFTYIWVIYGVNVGKYTIHGSMAIGELVNYRFSTRPIYSWSHGNSGSHGGMDTEFNVFFFQQETRNYYVCTLWYGK